ncbi:MAG: YitT family protein [Bacteroidales bacterium]
MNKKLLVLIKEYLIMTLAMAIYVFGWTAFLIPNQIPGGGVTGLSSIINYAFGIPVSYPYTFFNIVLLVAGTWILGKGFGIKTIYCIAISAVMFEFFPLIPWTSDIPDKLLNAIIGGACSGIGISLVFMQGGSTGGIDIVVLTLMVLTGSKQSVQILIISTKYKEIADTLNGIDKGVTAINSMGWYTKKDAMILLVVTRKSNLHEVMSAIKEIDHKAFLTVTGVMGVYGERFESIKA